MQRDHLPLVVISTSQSFHPAGDGVYPVAPAVGAKHLGRPGRVVQTGGLQPQSAQHRRPMATGRSRASREHRVGESGRQQRPQLCRWPSPVDDLEHAAQCRVGEIGRGPQPR